MLRKHWRTTWRKVRRELVRKRAALLQAQHQASGLSVLKQSATIAVDWAEEQQRLLMDVGPLLDDMFNAAKGWNKTQYEKTLSAVVSWEIYDENARQWAEKYKYDLVSQITDSTATQLGRVVSRWITTDEDLPALARRIGRIIPTDPFPTTRDRAMTIAQTETTRVFAESRRLLFKQAGLRQMRWRTANDELVCPICAPLNGKSGGLAGIMSPFDQRIHVPPAHVNCRCWLVEDTRELQELVGEAGEPPPPRRPARPVRRPTPPERKEWQPAMTIADALEWTEGSATAGMVIPLASYNAITPGDVNGFISGLKGEILPTGKVFNALGNDRPHPFGFASLVQEPYYKDYVGMVKLENPFVISANSFIEVQTSKHKKWLREQGYKSLWDWAEAHGHDGMLITKASGDLWGVMIWDNKRLTFLKNEAGELWQVGMAGSPEIKPAFSVKVTHRVGAEGELMSLAPEEQLAVERKRPGWKPGMTAEEIEAWKEGTLFAGADDALPLYVSTKTMESYLAGRGSLYASAVPEFGGTGTTSDTTPEVIQLNTFYLGPPGLKGWAKYETHLKITNPLVLDAEDYNMAQFLSFVDKLKAKGYKDFTEWAWAAGHDAIIIKNPGGVHEFYVRDVQQMAIMLDNEGIPKKFTKLGSDLMNISALEKSDIDITKGLPAQLPTPARIKRPTRKPLAGSISADEIQFEDLEAATGGAYADVLEQLDVDHAKLTELDLHSPDGPWGELDPSRHTSYGIVLIDEYDRVLLREPTDHFDGYTWTWAKGTPEPGQHPLNVALREALEETGYQAQVIGALDGRYSSAGSDTFFLVARVTDFNASAIDSETQRTRWVSSREDARKLLGQSANSTGRQRDLAVLDRVWQDWVDPIHARKTEDLLQRRSDWLANLNPLGTLPSGKPPIDVARLKQIKSLGGSHAVYLMEAEDGSQWVWKPQEQWRAEVDRVTYALAAALGHEIPETYVTRIGGRVGSLQRHYDAVTLNNYRGELSQDQILALQREAIFDWLISNHDGHEGNILLAHDGRIIGIDKGQAFKFFGRDRLDWDYAPNKGFGVVSWHNKILRRYAQGEDIKLADPSRHPELRAFIRKIESLSEGQVRDILTPYLDAMESAGTVPLGERERFIQEFMKRKKNLGRDFARLYRQARHQRAQVLGIAGEEIEVITPVEKVVRDATAAGWQGKTILMGGSDIEDMTVLVTQIEDNGALFELKVRAQAQEKLLMALLDEQSGSTWAERLQKNSQASAATAHDPYYDSVLTLAKSFNYHFVENSPGYDGKFPTHTAQGIKSTYGMLQNQAAKGDKAAEHHLPTVERLYKMLSGKIDTSKYAGKVVASPYEPQERARRVRPERRSSSETTARRREKIETPGVRNENGRLYTSQSQRRSGLMLEFELAPGIKAAYVPHDDNANHNQYSKQGKMWIKTDRPVDEETIGQVRQAMERINLSSRLATREDMEYMYLIKTTYAAIGDLQKTGVDLAHDTQRQVTEKLKAYWTNRLGVERLEDLPSWHPEPIFEGPAPTTEVEEGDFGIPKWRRFDIAEEDMEKIRQEVRLVHTLSSRDVIGFFDRVLKTNGALISTEEKFRIGIRVGSDTGISPEADQRTGGASYVFTRIRSSSKANSSYYDLVFDPELLTFTDVITYDHDLYGRTRPDDIARYRKRSPAEWLKIAKHGNQGNAGEETIVKGRINLMEWIDSINVRSAADKERLIKIMHDHDIYYIHSKKIEDVIVVVR